MVVRELSTVLCCQGIEVGNYLIKRVVRGLSTVLCCQGIELGNYLINGGAGAQYCTLFAGYRAG